MASILLVDAESSTRHAIATGLREQGHDVAESSDAGTALNIMDKQKPDLTVLEWALPDVAGIEVLKDIRSSDFLHPTRVVMTSGRGRTEDLVEALSSGADDFVGKPYSTTELLARVDACLRRPPNSNGKDELRAAGIRVDRVGHRVFVDDDSLSLAPREYHLLLFLMSNSDRVFSRSQLLVHVWNRTSKVGSRTVDVHIRRLRCLLEPYGYDRFVQTVRGSGYRFSPQT